MSSGNLAADRARLVTLLHRRSSWRATKALPLTGTQQGMWLAEQLAPGQSGYHDVAALGLTGVLDTEALHGAAQDARAGHEALRCRIVGTDEPRQVFDAEHLDWRVFDLSALPEQVRQDRVDRCVALASVEPFTLDEGPLWRVRLVRLSAQKHLLVCVVHHLISDGWSHGVLLRTLLAGYGARALGLTPASPPPATGYRDWLCDRLAREHAATASLAVDRLARELPRGPYRFRHPGLTGSGGERRAVGVRVPVPAAERAAFTRTCARSGATAYMGLTGLLALLLARTTGETGAVFAAPVAVRRPQDAPVMGCMVNAVPVVVNTTPHDTPAQAVAQGRAAVLAALRHTDVPYREIARAAGPPLSTADPLTNVGTEQFNVAMTSVRLGPLTVEPLPRTSLHLRHDLTLSMGEGSGGLLELWSPPALWSPGIVPDLAAELADLVVASAGGRRKNLSA
ncbi:condensation domain-containing protein [Streptomyces anulatus]|uniref:condensation domain-containing protein n=1 Tax=Streptomyces anulatus TaxID=1892 RepID=UPI00224F282C|nr:condensation domain-containing protein [Streptomyces anulatus]MCX4521955.1 condensation domain-containing protein [Streptomyces anulatus]MCX4604831.1 condensation domain-containing protein [Streptomyces anulatus]WTE29654.1 condensation domain-containing protein [Streptomyces anulatus]